MSNRIYVIGYYGYGNIGDDAMMLGLSEILKYKGYDNVRFYSKGQSLVKDFIWADDIVLGGGTHLRDWGKGCFKQTSRIIALSLASKMLSKNFHMLNVGVESRRLKELANYIADTVTIRDEQSFDSSIVLDVDFLPKDKILGVSLTPYYKLFEKDNYKDKTLVFNIVSKINKWLFDHKDWRVAFFNFNKDDEEINMLASSLISKSEFRAFKDDVKGMLREVSECSNFIGMRYHSNLFAYATGASMVVIDTYPSCSKLANFIGVKSITKKQILENNFKLDFQLAKLPVSIATSLAFGGIRI